MAASTDRKRTAQGAVSAGNDNLRWTLGLLLLFAGIFLLASVLFYYFDWRADYSVLNGIGAEDPRFDDTIENPCGRLGAWAAEQLVGRSFGLFGIILPFIVAMVGRRVLRRQPLVFHHSVLSALLVLILGSLTLGVVFDDAWGVFNSGLGGAYGIEVGRLLVANIGKLGCAILLLGGWILTGVFINRKFINTVNRAGNVIVDQSSKLAGTVRQVPNLVLHHPKTEDASDVPAPTPDISVPEAAVPAGEPSVRCEDPLDEPSPFLEEIPADGQSDEPETAAESDDPFEERSVGGVPERSVRTVNDMYARALEDGPFVEVTLGDEPSGADVAEESVAEPEEPAVPERAAGDDPFEEIDLAHTTAAAVAATSQTAGSGGGSAVAGHAMQSPANHVVGNMNPAVGDEEAGGVVVTVESHRDAEVDARQITTEAYDPLKDLVNYRRPSIDLLENYQSDSEVSDEEIFENKTRIEDTLKNFGIPIQKIKATPGPTVTLYEIVQAQGVKISKIQGLQNDIAQSLKALGIRIIAPIPGKGTIGIEVPNRSKETVSMYSAIRSLRFQKSTAELPVVIGRTIQNENYVFDLTRMPHLLVAGATGQGKSVGLNAIITSLLYRKHPAQLKFVMIDPKQVEFSLYAKLERHFLAKMESEEEAIITDPRKAVYTLNALCQEMEERLGLCKEAGARNIKEYNEKFTARRLNPRKGHRYLPYIVVVVDEFADLIMTAREVEGPVMRLAQKARAIGIHLIIATQRPDVKVITGGIKANFPARIAFRVMQMIDSRTIIDRPGAEQLIGRGDMLISQDGELTRIQCAFVDTPEVERVVEYISKQQGYTSAYALPDYTPESGDPAAGGGLGSESSAPVRYDAKFAEIARDAVSSGQISTSMIQRNYEVGFNRAGRIMMQLERAGIVGRQEGAKPRDILYHDLPSLEAKLQELGVF